MNNIVVNRKKAKSWLFEGIVIAAIPSFGYFIAFLYELGFCNVFNIPIQFISLNLTVIFIAVGALIVLLTGLFLIVNWIYLIIAPYYKKDNPIWNTLLISFPVLILLLGYILLYWSLWKEWLFAFIVFLFFIFLDFVFPLITQRKKGTYIEKLKAQEEFDSEEKDLFTLIRQRFGRTALLIIIGFFYISLFAYSTGQATALRQHEFLITNTIPTKIVLRVYNEKMILVPFDEETKEITEDSSLTLSLREIGPLKISE